LASDEKNGTNTAAIRGVKEDVCLNIELRQSKYLNNIIGQEHGP